MAIASSNQFILKIVHIRICQWNLVTNFLIMIRDLTHNLVTVKIQIRTDQYSILIISWQNLIFYILSIQVSQIMIRINQKTFNRENITFIRFKFKNLNLFSVNLIILLITILKTHYLIILGDFTI